MESQITTLVVYVVLFIVLIFVGRLLGAWMLRINELIKHTKTASDELTLLRKYYEREKGMK